MTTIILPMSEPVATLKLRVRLPRLMGARFWLAARLFVLAGHIAGFGAVEILPVKDD